MRFLCCAAAVDTSSIVVSQCVTNDNCVDPNGLPVFDKNFANPHIPLFKHRQPCTSFKLCEAF